MAFVRFSSSEHKLEAREFKLVAQDMTLCEVFSQNEMKPLFLAEGLNPCMGISIHGVAQTDDDDEEPDAFAIFYHCAGLTIGEVKKLKNKRKTKMS